MIERSMSRLFHHTMYETAAHGQSTSNGANKGRISHEESIPSCHAGSLHPPATGLTASESECLSAVSPADLHSCVSILWIFRIVAASIVVDQPNMGIAAIASNPPRLYRWAASVVPVARGALSRLKTPPAHFPTLWLVMRSRNSERAGGNIAGRNIHIWSVFTLSVRFPVPSS
jgi:hypothetical protein